QVPAERSVLGRFGERARDREVKLAGARFVEAAQDRLAHAIVAESIAVVRADEDLGFDEVADRVERRAVVTGELRTQLERQLAVVHAERLGEATRSRVEPADAHGERSRELVWDREALEAIAVDRPRAVGVA